MGHAITLYLDSKTHELLEKERHRLGLESKPITIARILKTYFREKGMLSEEED